MKLSPRFVFTGQQMESTQVDEGDRHDDYYPNAESPVFCVFEQIQKIYLQFSHRKNEEDLHRTSLEWPAPGHPTVELADAVEEALQGADPEGTDPILNSLREQIKNWKT